MKWIWRNQAVKISEWEETGTLGQSRKYWEGGLSLGEIGILLPSFSDL